MRRVEFLEAGFGHVLGVGLELGGGRGQLAAAVAGGVEGLAGGADDFFELGDAGADSGGLFLQGVDALFGGEFFCG